MSNPLRLLMWIPLGVVASSGCAAPARTDLAQSPSQLVPSSAQVQAASDASAGSRIESVDTAASLVRDAALRKGVSPQEAEEYHALVHDVDPRFKGLMTSLVYAKLNRETAETEEEDIEPIQALPAHRQAVDARQQHIEGVAHASVDKRELPPGAGPVRTRLADDLRADSEADTARRALPENVSSRRTKPVDAAANESSEVERPAAPDAADETAQPADSPPPDQSSEPHTPGSWRKQLREAIEQLQRELGSEQAGEENRVRMQARLGLLCLAAEDLEKSMQVLDGLDEQQLEFWRQTMMGLGVLLASDELPKFRHRVDSASKHLSSGISSLATLGPLRLANLTFCTKVNGFGDVMACDPYSLQPGAPVLLYVEVENFTVEETGVQVASSRSHSSSRRTTPSDRHDPIYETELLGRYEIFDADQRQIVSRTLPVSRDTCRNHRRDYFIPYTIYMPDQIAPGSYTLELTIEDKKGDKFGNAVIDFRIR